MPSIIYVTIGAICGLLAALEYARAEWYFRERVNELMDEHALHCVCYACWQDLERARTPTPDAPLRDTPPQLPLTERMFETCCYCGDTNFDGVYWYLGEPLPFCKHPK